MPCLCGRGLPPRFAFWKSGFSSGPAEPPCCRCFPRGSCDHHRDGDALAARLGPLPGSPKPRRGPRPLGRAPKREALARSLRRVARAMRLSVFPGASRFSSHAPRPSLSPACSSCILSPAPLFVPSPVPADVRGFPRALPGRALYTRFPSENGLQNGDFSQNFSPFGLKACPISCFASCSSIFPSRRQCAKCAFQTFAFGSAAMNSSPS